MTTIKLGAMLLAAAWILSPAPCRALIMTPAREQQQSALAQLRQQSGIQGNAPVAAPIGVAVQTGIKQAFDRSSFHNKRFMAPPPHPCGLHLTVDGSFLIVTRIQNSSVSEEPSCAIPGAYIYKCVEKDCVRVLDFGGTPSRRKEHIRLLDEGNIVLITSFGPATKYIRDVKP